MKKLEKEKRNSLIWLSVVAFVTLVIYCSRATTSALWFDEGIEYYYSKFLNGTVPGGFGTETMYQRIVFTYQPPLYNWLMYVWLKIYDSEFWFRLAGILVTVAGGVGVYKALERLADYKWAAAGMLVYLFTCETYIYALECAEYNLMLCFICWTVYFFICAYEQQDVKSLVGFFACAVLTVYSQYGGVFIIVPLYAVLGLHLLIKKTKILPFAALSAVTAVLATLLLKYFLLPQLKHQGSISVSHKPFFAYGNPIKDFILTLKAQVGWNFADSIGNYQVAVIVKAVVLISGILAVAALISKEKTYIVLASVTAGSWLIYYAAVACSFYGYNNWKSSFGTQNIGNRYGLLFTPLWAFVLFYGVYVFTQWLEKKLRDNKRFKSASTVSVICVCLMCVYCVLNTFNLYSTSIIKEDIRDVTEIWYEKRGYETATVVHEWDDGMFNFYFTHNKAFDESYRENVVITDSLMRVADYNQMSTVLAETGCFEKDGFYYICPSNENTKKTLKPSNSS